MLAVKKWCNIMLKIITSEYYRKSFVRHTVKEYSSVGIFVLIIAGTSILIKAISISPPSINKSTFLMVTIHMKRERHYITTAPVLEQMPISTADIIEFV